MLVSKVDWVKCGLFFKLRQYICTQCGYETCVCFKDSRFNNFHILFYIASVIAIKTVVFILIKICATQKILVYFLNLLFYQLLRVLILPKKS